MPSFSEILAKPTVFRNRDVLSPHYVPEVLPFRENEIRRIMEVLSSVLRNERPHNLFIYGKTGSGKTCCVKHVLGKLDAEKKENVHTCYVNCRIYNSRYRVMQRVGKTFLPELDKAGFGIQLFYEKLLAWLNSGKRLIIALDEIDIVKDLDELVYTLSRANDELEHGSISLIGITNKLSFKEELDPRSKSSLYESEILFSPYTPPQLQGILEQRVALAFRENSVHPSAINLAAAIAAQETGDARYALKLLLRAGEIADEKGKNSVSDEEVDAARKSVEQDVARDAVSTLPEHQQLLLYGIANLSLLGRRYAKLSEDDDGHFLLSGEVYEEYSRVCRIFKKKKRSARWYREYLNDLEMLGLITTVESGRGIRGHTRLVKIGYSPEEIKRIVEENLSIIEGGNE